MRKRAVLLIAVGAFGALCWTAVTLLCAFVASYRSFELIARCAERTVMVERESLESEPGITVLDANNPVFRVLMEEPNRVKVKWEEGIPVQTNGRFTWSRF